MFPQQMAKLWDRVPLISGMKVLQITLATVFEITVISFPAAIIRFPNFISPPSTGGEHSSSQTFLIALRDGDDSIKRVASNG